MRLNKIQIKTLTIAALALGLVGCEELARIASERFRAEAPDEVSDDGDPIPDPDPTPEPSPTPSPTPTPTPEPTLVSRFVAVGYGGHRISSDDGLHWENEQLLVAPGVAGGDDDNVFRGIGFGNGLFVAVGGSGRTLIMTSKDGAAWVNQSVNRGWMGDVKYGNGIYFGAGGNGLHMIGTPDSSPGGVQWTFYHSGTQPQRPNVQASDIDVILPSGAQLNWGSHIRRVAVGKNADRTKDIFIAFGDGGRRSVTDGSLNAQGRVHWLKHWNSGTPLVQMAYGNGVFVGVGYNGVREISTDGGLNWTTYTASQGLAPNCAPLPTSSPATQFNNVVWTGSQFVALSNDAIAVSTDGTSWSWYNYTSTVYASGFGNGKFIGFNGWDINRAYIAGTVSGANRCGNAAAQKLQFISTNGVVPIFSSSYNAIEAIAHGEIEN